MSNVPKLKKFSLSSEINENLKILPKLATLINAMWHGDNTGIDQNLLIEFKVYFYKIQFCLNLH